MNKIKVLDKSILFSPKHVKRSWDVTNTRVALTAYVLSKAGEQTNFSYVDSTKLVVCHNKRTSEHQVFKGIAERGYSSVGYFFGFKLHLAINQQGELVSFCLTRG